MGAHEDPRERAEERGGTARRQRHLAPSPGPAAVWGGGGAFPFFPPLPFLFNPPHFSITPRNPYFSYYSPPLFFLYINARPDVCMQMQLLEAGLISLPVATSPNTTPPNKHLFHTPPPVTTSTYYRL